MPPAAACATTPAGSRPIPVEFLYPGPFQPRGPIERRLARRTRRIRSAPAASCSPCSRARIRHAPGRYQIIAGERRWRAAQAAGLHEVPALVRDLTDAEAMAAAPGRKPPAPGPQRHRGSRRLPAAARRIRHDPGTAGRSRRQVRSHVANTCACSTCRRTVQMEVREGGLTAGHARALLAHPDPENAALAVIARGLNVRQTEALARPARRPPPGGRARACPARTRKPSRWKLSFPGDSGLRSRSLSMAEGAAACVSTTARWTSLDGIVALLNRSDGSGALPLDPGRGFALAPHRGLKPLEPLLPPSG